MRDLMILYGKPLFGIGLLLFLLTGSVVLLWSGWNRFGIPVDGTTTTVRFQNPSLMSEIPVIEAQNRRICQGEEICVSDLAVARDVNGEDISGRLVFQNEKGDLIKGRFNTKKPGEYTVVISVKSRITAKENKKSILVLVDGKVRP